MSKQTEILSQKIHDRNLISQDSLVYPVLSRRLGGISIGINTSPSKFCNFNCVYCEVNRKKPMPPKKFDLDLATSQLIELVENVNRGQFGYKIIKAITFSGDGEPTTLANFEGVVERVVEVRKRLNLLDSKIVVISNASGLARETVRWGLELVYHNNGELWAKLDAGTVEYFKKISRTQIPFSKILNNITETSHRWPITIQTCFLNVENIPPMEDECEEYCRRVNEIIKAGGKITQIQLYTVSRPPAEPSVTALTQEQKEQISAFIAKRLTVPLEIVA